MNKRIVSMLSLLAVVLVAAFTACNGSGKDAADKKISEEQVYAIVDKFDEGKIEEKDYAEAIDIFKAYNDLMLEEAEKQLAGCKTDREFNKKMERFVRRYTFMSELGYVFNVPESQMGKKNYENLMKLQQEIETKMQKLQSKVEAKYYKDAAPAAMPLENAPETAAAAPAESAAAAPAPAPAAK